jgi:hypothetical protein
MDENKNEERAREFLDGLRQDPQRSARLTLGCVLTLAVVELLQHGMPVGDVHDIVELTSTYGVPEEKDVTTVWVYLLAYAAKGLFDIGLDLPEVHQAVDVSSHALQRSE